MCIYGRFSRKSHNWVKENPKKILSDNLNNLRIYSRHIEHFRKKVFHHSVYETLAIFYLIHISHNILYLSRARLSSL